MFSCLHIFKYINYESIHRYCHHSCLFRYNICSELFQFAQEFYIRLFPWRQLISLVGSSHWHDWHHTLWRNIYLCAWHGGWGSQDDLFRGHSRQFPRLYPNHALPSASLLSPKSHLYIWLHPTTHRAYVLQNKCRIIPHFQTHRCRVPSLHRGIGASNHRI